MNEAEQIAFKEGAEAMRKAIDEKLLAWHEWIKRDAGTSHSQQMTLCAYAGARMVAHLVSIPEPLEQEP